MFEPPTHTGVDEVHAHPRHSGHRWLDLILALTAVFISGVSLTVAIEHGRIERQLVQANSWPFLQIEGNYSTRSATQITLVDAGIGPAKLESLAVLYKGAPVDDLFVLLERCCDLPKPPAERHAVLPDGLSINDAVGEVLRPGQVRSVMSIPGSPDNHALSERFLAASTDITYRACYCSVFDQCWMSNLSGLHPRSVAACPAEPHDFNHGYR